MRAASVPGVAALTGGPAQTKRSPVTGPIPTLATPGVATANPTRVAAAMGTAALPWRVGTCITYQVGTTTGSSGSTAVAPHPA